MPSFLLEDRMEGVPLPARASLEARYPKHSVRSIAAQAGLGLGCRNADVEAKVKTADKERCCLLTGFRHTVWISSPTWMPEMDLQLP
jgi:hypothetical protein